MKFLLVGIVLALNLIQASQGSPAEARVREQFDKEHEEGIDRIRLKLHDLQAAEAGNRNRETVASQVDKEVRIKGQRGRGGVSSVGGISGGSSRAQQVQQQVQQRQQAAQVADASEEVQSPRKGGSGGGSGGGNNGREEDDDEQEQVQVQEAPAPRRSSGGGSGGGGRGRGGDVQAYLRSRDAKSLDRGHEDVARYANQDDIDFARDSYRLKDKSSHKKEEVYQTRK